MCAARNDDGPPEDQLLSPDRVIAFFRRIWKDRRDRSETAIVPADRIRIHRTAVPTLSHDEQLLLNVMTGFRSRGPEDMRHKLELWRLITVGTLERDAIDPLDQLVLSVLEDLERETGRGD